MTVGVPSESVAPELGETLSQLPPLVATVALKVVPDVLLANENVCPAGGLPGVALKVNDVGVAVSVGAGAPPPLPATVRLMVAVLELLPRVAVTVAL